jgi:hypothetical protein
MATGIPHHWSTDDPSASAILRHLPTPPTCPNHLGHARKYSCRSAYNALFQGHASILGAKQLANVDFLYGWSSWVDAGLLSASTYIVLVSSSDTCALK